MPPACVSHLSLVPVVGEQPVLENKPSLLITLNKHASALKHIWGDNTVPWYNLSICKASPSFLGFRLASSLPWGVLPFSPPPIERSSNEAFLDCWLCTSPRDWALLASRSPQWRPPQHNLNEGPPRTTSGSQFFCGGMLDEWGTIKLVSYQLNSPSHLIVPHRGFLLFLMYLNR